MAVLFISANLNMYCLADSGTQYDISSRIDVKSTWPFSPITGFFRNTLSAIKAKYTVRSLLVDCDIVCNRVNEINTVIK